MLPGWPAPPAALSEPLPVNRYLLPAVNVTPAQRRYLRKLAAGANPRYRCQISHLIEAGVLEMQRVDLCAAPGQLAMVRPALTEAGRRLVAGWNDH